MSTPTTRSRAEEPSHWPTARADDNDAITNVKIVPMGSGIHVTLGPAIILYKSANEGKGPFHTLATFTQTKPTKHAEGYGLFAGGRGLDGPGQVYVYFLVRQDGSYLIKRRDGDKTKSDHQGMGDGRCSEEAGREGLGNQSSLEIDHKRDPSKVVFLVNSKPVYTTDAKAVDLTGMSGSGSTTIWTCI